MVSNWIDDSLIFSGVKGYIDTLSENMKLPPAVIIQNMIIRRLAEEDATAAVYGEREKLLSEFISMEGELVTGQELYNIIYQDEMKQLEMEVVNSHMAVPWEGCTDIAKEILTKYGYGPEAEKKKEQEKQKADELRKKYNIPKRKPGSNAHWEE